MKRISFLLTVPLLACALMAAGWSRVQAQETYKPVLAPGEMYYSGMGSYKDCESTVLGFILSADKSEVREFTIKLQNLKVVTQDGNMSTEHKIGSMETIIYPGAPVTNGQADVTLAGEHGTLILRGLGEKDATAELDYSITLDTGLGGMGASNKVKVPLGTTKIALKGGFEAP